MAFRVSFKKPNEKNFKRIGLAFTEQQAMMEGANLMKQGFDIHIKGGKKPLTIYQRLAQGTGYVVEGR